MVMMWCKDFIAVAISGSSMKQHFNKSGGYIALLSAIIISAMLLVLSVSLSQGGYFMRFNTLNTEYKKISMGLAESCINAALLRIAHDYSYILPSSDETVAVGSETCEIVSISHGVETVGHQKDIIVVVRSEYQGAWSNLKVKVNVGNPDFAPSNPMSPRIVVGVLEEL
jgi:hypothetical protein